MMRPKMFLTWMSAFTLMTVTIASSAQAQTATFSRFNDALPGRCYNAATTATDPSNPNRLIIGQHPPTSTGLPNCYASDNGPKVLMDTFSFHVEAPTGYFISKITFTQNMRTAGSRGGRGFAGANWVVDDDALRGPGSVDLTLQRKTFLPVSITTYLAAFGGTVMSGSASATNPVVVVELAPLQ